MTNTSRKSEGIYADSTVTYHEVSPRKIWSNIRIVWQTFVVVYVGQGLLLVILFVWQPFCCSPPFAPHSFLTARIGLEQPYSYWLAYCLCYWVFQVCCFPCTDFLQLSSELHVIQQSFFNVSEVILHLHD